MQRHRPIPHPLALGMLIALAGCQAATEPSEVVAVDPAPALAPVVVPFGEVVSDLNPCTGNATTYTFNGTARIQVVDDHYLLVASGTVKTDDGFAGIFNRQYVVQGDRVTVLRFHDMEVSAGSGERILFGVGLFVEISPNTAPVVTLTQFSGLRCAGHEA